MDANLLVFGRPTPPEPPILLTAGPLTLEFHPEAGGIRYLELPDGTEAVRAVYPSVRYGDWRTDNPKLSNIQVDRREDGFSISYDLGYELPYSAKVRIEGSVKEIVFSYEGVASEAYETSRTGLCVLHPANLADEPVEIRHPDGTKESGRYPDLVEPHWPFREVVGVSSKFPGYKVDITMEGETFEMEDQRNFGDASFKTYCRPQSRPFPYMIAAGERVTQTVRVTAKPWGSPVEEVPPLPEREAGVIFIEETLPVPLIGFVAKGDTDPSTIRRAPLDYLRVPAEEAVELGVPLELSLDLSQGAKEKIERAKAKIAELPQPPDRIVLSPISAREFVKEFKSAEEDLVLLSTGTLVDLNRSDLKPQDADGVGFGFQPQGHLIDDATLFENTEAIPDLAATAAEKTEGPVVMGPIRLGGGPDPRTNSLVFAAWTVAALSSLMRSDVDAATFFDLEGPDGLFRDGKPIPAYHVFADLHEFAEGEALVGIGTARRATGFAIVKEESFRAIVANLTAQPLQRSVVAAGDAEHEVKILDGRNVAEAVENSEAWRELAGEMVAPVEGVVTFDLGPYGVATVDAEVDDYEEEE